MTKRSRGSPESVPKRVKFADDPVNDDDAAVYQDVDFLSMQLGKIGLDKPVERRVEEHKNRIYRKCEKRLATLQSRLQSQTEGHAKLYTGLKQCEYERGVLRDMFATIKNMIRKEEGITLDDRRVLNDMIRTYNGLIQT